MDLIARLKTLGKPGGMLDPTSEAIMTDTVLVYTTTYGVDDRGGPTQSDGATAALPCQIFTSTTGVQSAPPARRDDREDRPEGRTRYTILFATDPGVSRPDQRLDWTAHNGSALAPARTLRAVAASRPPGGGDLIWKVDAEELS